MIDRYEPADRRPRDDFYNNPREHAAREREDRRRPPSPTVVNIDRYVPGQDSGKRPLPTNPLPHPLNLEFQVGFNWFAEWWKAEQAVNEERERAKYGGRRPIDRVRGEREALEDRDKSGHPFRPPTITTRSTCKSSCPASLCSSIGMRNGFGSDMFRKFETSCVRV